MDLYNFILVIKSDFPPVLLSRQHYQFLHLQKNNQLCSKQEVWMWDPFMPPCHPSHRHGYCASCGSRRSAFQITSQYSPPKACAVPPGQEGADGDGKGHICSAASLLFPLYPSIHPSSWPLGVPVGPRSARQRLSLLPGFGCALAPVSPPWSLSSKASQLVKLLLCAPLM